MDYSTQYLRKAALILAATAFAGVGAPASGATTNTVETAAQLESAFASVANNTVLLLKPGTYELSSHQLCCTNRNVGLFGVAADGVTPASRGEVVVSAVDGNHDGAGDFRILYFEGQKSTQYTLSLRHITFRGGSATGQGGAIHVNSTKDTLDIEDCVFEGNASTGNGGAVSTTGPFAMADCEFANNVAGANGGALFVGSGGKTTASVEIDRCSFRGNSAGGTSGGAVSLGDSSTQAQRAFHIRNCLFAGNRLTTTTATSVGGALYARANASVTGQVDNCTFVGNSAGSYIGTKNTYTRGGAIYESTPLAISNCIFYVNRSIMTTPANWVADKVDPWKYAHLNAANRDYYALVGNCLFCNDPDYPALDFASDFSTSYDGITPVSDGVNGNKVGAYEPGFSNAAASNYTLAKRSVCIDAGSSAPWMAGTYDLRNDPKVPRIIGAAVDLGCYEWFDQHKATVLLIR